MIWCIVSEKPRGILAAPIDAEWLKHWHRDSVSKMASKMAFRQE
jgi:hypothetical protein